MKRKCGDEIWTLLHDTDTDSGGTDDSSGEDESDIECRYSTSSENSAHDVSGWVDESIRLAK